MSRRGTSNGNCSGNSYGRRARRARLWRRYSRCFGRCGRVKCWYCPRLLTKREFEVDRYVCGHDGGRYVDKNCVPACAECNRNKCALRCKRGVAAPKAESASPFENCQLCAIGAAHTHYAEELKCAS